MLDNDELIKRLNDDIELLENKIEHKRFYNIRNAVIRTLIKSGIAIDYAFPFIIAATIFGSMSTARGNAPFIKDEIATDVNELTIVTSNGIYIEQLSDDLDYNKQSLEYSTSWVLDEKGLYKRLVTSYNLNVDLDLDDENEIIKMTKEDIDNNFEIADIRTVTQEKLSPADAIYNSAAIIITDNKTVPRLETNSENVANTSWFIFMVLASGNLIRNLENTFAKQRVRDRLRECELSFRKIDKKELETMKKVLLLNKENLSMLNCNTQTNNYSYKLRRK